MSEWPVVESMACDVYAGARIYSIEKTRRLSVTALRSLARLLLGLLVFLHGFPLFLGRFFRVLLLLLGRPLRLDSILSDAPVLPLSMGRYRHGNTQSE
jgi:hypothetical protein